VLSFWFVIFFSAHAFAVDPYKTITQYAHTAWRTQDGFFAGTPCAITQTADGYIWIATRNDLFQFDGVRLIKWAPPVGSQLPSSRINSLLGSSDAAEGRLSNPAAARLRSSRGAGAPDCMLAQDRCTMSTTATRIGISTQDLTLIPSGLLLPRRPRSRTRFAGWSRNS
jgi:hypothetical protein